MASPKRHFQTSSLYKNVTLVAWDPAPYTLNLHKVGWLIYIIRIFTTLILLVAVTGECPFALEIVVGD